MHDLFPTGNESHGVLVQVAPQQSGSLVYKIDPLAPAHEVLKENDVVMQIDGVPIADDGTVEFRNEERVEFSHIVRAKHIGEAFFVSALFVCHVKTGRAERQLSVSICHDMWAGQLQDRHYL